MTPHKKPLDVVTDPETAAAVRRLVRDVKKLWRRHRRHARRDDQ